MISEKLLQGTGLKYGANNRFSHFCGVTLTLQLFTQTAIHVITIYCTSTQPNTKTKYQTQNEGKTKKNFTSMFPRDLKHCKKVQIGTFKISPVNIPVSQNHPST